MQSGYKDLKVFQKAHELAIAIYRVTKKFPREEIFGLTPQMRRCVASVPANIVEGYGRNGKKDKLQFLYIARGSLNELGYYIELARDLGYYLGGDYEYISKLEGETAKLLHGFIKFSQRQATTIP